MHDIKRSLLFPAIWMLPLFALFAGAGCGARETNADRAGVAELPDVPLHEIADADFEARERGAGIYRLYCAACHGRDRQGVTAPALERIDPEDLPGLERSLSAIAHGVPGTAMVGWKHILSEDEMFSVMAFLYGEQSSEPDGRGPPDAVEP